MTPTTTLLPTPAESKSSTEPPLPARPDAKIPPAPTTVFGPTSMFSALPSSLLPPPPDEWELPSAPSDVAPAAPEASKRTRFFEQASLVLPLVGLGVGAVLAWRGKRGARTAGLATMGGALAAALARWQLARAVTEKVRYEVELHDGNFEVRNCAPCVHAQTVVEAVPWEQALNDGFDRIAKYIFGGNAKQLKIAMTAPVMASIGEADRVRRTVAFKMPDRYSLAALPTPTDSAVTLRQVPARRVAALRFSGRYGTALPAQKGQELLSRVRAAGLRAVGELTFGGYDAPWTLPLLRRNEVMVEVATHP